jgi:hypothetical protein
VPAFQRCGDASCAVGVGFRTHLVVFRLKVASKTGNKNHIEKVTKEMLDKGYQVVV